MKKRYIMAMAAIGIIMTACSENELNEHENGWKGNEPLQLSASISETVLGRAEGDFTAGKYYFSYVNNTQTSLRYTDKETEFDGSGTGTSDLTWDKVNTNSNLKNKLFILDNVPFQIVNNEIEYFTSGTDGNGYINLNGIMEAEKKYQAAPAPVIPGTGNDLLWDTVKVADQIPLSPVHFELEHRMSMLTFELFSNVPQIKELLKQKVTVKLEGVITNPATFNRATGVVSVIYDNNVTSTIEDLGVLEATEKEGGVARYTQSWIFPPQRFDKIGARPVLEVTLSNTDGTETKKFRGRLPESMVYDKKSELLEFISGCHLIIEVKLGNRNDMEIRFRPVLVREWIPKTLVDINVDQVGIRTAEELSDLVSTYNNNPNDSKLWKYGVLKDETWYFDLWKDISIPSITNDLGFSKNQNPGFKIISHGYKINGKTVNYDGTLKDEEETETNP